MINMEDKQKIKDDVQNCFIERNENTIHEKISDCIRKGFNKDEARHTVIQIVKNLPNHLLSIKATPQEDAVSDYKLTIANKEEVCSDELLISDKTLDGYKLSEHLPAQEDTPEDIDRYFLH
mgnify:CR=1 FL=1